MANIFSRLFGKKPARPASEKGERGTGKGKLHVGEVEEFVHEGALLVCSSSNVSDAVYSKADQKLIISFLNGSAYAYSPVSEAWAYSFAEAGSKGKWIFDYLRERGKGADHRHRAGISCVRIR